MKKSFHTVKKAGILTAAAVLGSERHWRDAAVRQIQQRVQRQARKQTEAAGEAEASDAQLVIAGGDSAGLIAAVQAAAEGMDPSEDL